MYKNVPVRIELTAAVTELAMRQFALWQAARASQGVLVGDIVIPEVSHPDVMKSWESLPSDTRNFIIGLTWLRVEGFRSDLVTRVRLMSEIELGEELCESVAIEFHKQWLALRTLLGLTVSKPHPGDKPWEDETTEERRNDSILCSHWRTLLRSLAADAENCTFAGRLLE